MSLDGKNALAIAASTAIAEQRKALVSRGLGDLSKWLHPRARVLLVNNQQALLEEMEQILVTAGCEVRSACRQSDAINMATSFFAEENLYGCSPKEFNPQFVMLGLAVPSTLGAELFASDRQISKLIHWGEVHDEEEFEQRREHYDFELLSTPIDPEKLHIQLTSWIAEAWTVNGNLLDGQERHSEALECHEEALRLDPLCISGWMNKGLCLNIMGRFPDAVESYERAIEIDASSWRPWVEKGYILGKMGRHADAISCFDAAIKLSADRMSAWKGRGLALDQLGRYEDAIASYDEVFKIDLPGWSENGKASYFADVWNLKGIAFAHANLFRDAIDCYERSINMDPESYLPYYNKAIALMRTGHLDEAILYYEKALSVFPDHSESWHNKGICLRDLGRLEEAIGCFDNALFFGDPPEVLAWYSLAQTFEALGRMQDAIHDYEKYLENAIPGKHPETAARARERIRDLKSRIGVHGRFNLSD